MQTPEEERYIPLAQKMHLESYNPYPVSHVKHVEAELHVVHVSGHSFKKIELFYPQEKNYFTNTATLRCKKSISTSCTGTIKKIIPRITCQAF